MELIKVSENEIQVAEETLKKMAYLNEAKTQLNILEDQVREALLKAMKDNGIKKIDNEVFTAVYKEPTTRKGVDTKRLKDEGLYELYLKETPVKESIAFSYK